MLYKIERCFQNLEFQLEQMTDFADLSRDLVSIKEYIYTLEDRLEYERSLYKPQRLEGVHWT
ncbi:MAG: hypothetical protein ACHQ1D_00330 [Nitrososphaerales archaeon]